MRYFLFGLLVLQIGCATKYMVAGNRFITPESQGGNLRSQFELQSVTASQHIVNTGDEGGVKTSSVDRTGYLFETSLFESFDFFWSHTGGANSMLGGKFQFLGPSRAGGSGHKMSVGAGFGANEHELEGDPRVEFKLGGQEYLLMYGYRWNEFVLNYVTFSRANYSFEGEIFSSNPLINGLKPNNETRVTALYGGTEFDYSFAVAKLECGYQKLETTDTDVFTHLFCGWSIGFHWN